MPFQPPRTASSFKDTEFMIELYSVTALLLGALGGQLLHDLLERTEGSFE